MKPDVQSLAIQFDKPVAFVEAALRSFGIKELPKFRTPDDGLSDFYSAMTSVYFDPDFEFGLDSKGKPYFPSRSVTKQEFTEELDLNVIMARFAASEFDPTMLPVTTRKALSGDFTGAPESYHAALNFVKDTEMAFMTLDAKIRERFDNDPQAFLDFVSNPENADELVEMGLATRNEESLSTTLARSFKELGDKVVGKDGQADPVPSKPSKKASSAQEADSHN